MIITNEKKLRLCVIGNMTILLFVFILAYLFKDNSKYWNIGPNDDLYIVSVKVNSNIKYLFLMLVIFIVNSSKTIIDSIGFSITNFNTYNPDKKIIKDFSKNELQVSTNMMSLTRNMREIFLMMASISQIDIAIYSVLVIELSNIYTVRMILNNKIFTKKTATSCLEIISIPNENIKSPKLLKSPNKYYENKNTEDNDDDVINIKYEDYNSDDEKLLM